MKEVLPVRLHPDHLADQLTARNPPAVKTVTGLDFGVFLGATFSGEVFNDLNGNGILDNGEPGIPAWTVNLLNSSSTVVAATTTDSSGDYSFTAVGPGSYTIVEVQQSGYTSTTATTIAVTATSGRVSTGNNFGEFAISTLSGEVFNDLNGNGASTVVSPGSPAGPSTCSTTPAL